MLGPFFSPFLTGIIWNIHKSIGLHVGVAIRAFDDGPTPTELTATTLNQPPLQDTTVGVQCGCQQTNKQNKMTSEILLIRDAGTWLSCLMCHHGTNCMVRSNKFSTTTLCSNNYFDISIEAIKLISNTEFDTAIVPHIWNEIADSCIVIYIKQIIFR